MKFKQASSLTPNVCFIFSHMIKVFCKRRYNFWIELHYSFT